MVSYVLSLLIEKEGIAVKAQVPTLTNNPSQTHLRRVSSSRTSPSTQTKSERV